MEVGNHKELSIWQFTQLVDWLNWLEENHDSIKSGIWIKIAKKNSTTKTVSYEEVREGALCYGWIDSLPNKFDEMFYLLKVTPRRPKSVWSQINTKLCEEFIAQGKMRPAGLAEVAAAKQDGRWDLAYRTGEIPRRNR